MSSEEICHEYELSPEQVMAVKQLSREQVQYIKGYADAPRKRSDEVRKA
jgi:hypothetical protein